MAEPIAAEEKSAPPPPRRPTIIRAGATPSISSEGVNNTVENGDVPPPVPPPPRPTSLPPPIPDSRPSTAPLALPPRPAHAPPPKPPTPTSIPKTSTSAPATKGRPEITIISARPMSEVTGMTGMSGLPGNSVTVPYSSTPPVPPPPVPSNRPKPDGPGRPPPPPVKPVSPSDSVPANRESPSIGSEVLNVGSGSASSSGRNSPASVVRSTPSPSGQPPPVPTNRPSGPYVPPPIPTNRPSGSYVHPVGATAPPPRPSSTPSKSGSSEDISPAPVAKPLVSESEVKQGVGTGGPPLPVRPKSVYDSKVAPPVPPLPASKPVDSSTNQPDGGTVSPTPPAVKPTSPTPAEKSTSPPPVSPKPSPVKTDTSSNELSDLAKIRQSLSPVSHSPTVSPPPIGVKPSVSPPPVAQKPAGPSPPPVAQKAGTATTHDKTRSTAPPIATKPTIAAKPSVPSKPTKQFTTTTQPSVHSQIAPQQSVQSQSQQITAMSSAGMFGVSLRPTIGPGIEEPVHHNQTSMTTSGGSALHSNQTSMTTSGGSALHSNQTSMTASGGSALHSNQTSMTTSGSSALHSNQTFSASGAPNKNPDPFATAMPTSSQPKNQTFQQKQNLFSSQQQDPFFTNDPFGSHSQTKDSFSFQSQDPFHPKQTQPDPFQPKQTQPDPFTSNQTQPDPFSPKQTQSEPFGSWPPPSTNTQNPSFESVFDPQPVPQVSSQTAPPVPGSRPRPKSMFIKPTATAVPITTPPPPVPTARPSSNVPAAWQPTPQPRGSADTGSKSTSQDMGSFIKEIEDLYAKPIKPGSPQTVQSGETPAVKPLPPPSAVKPPSTGGPAIKPPLLSGGSAARPTIIRATTTKSKGGPPPRPSGGPKVASGSTDVASLLDMPIPQTQDHKDTLKKSSSTSALGRSQSMRTAPPRPSDLPKKKAPAPPRPTSLTKGPTKPPRSAPGVPGSKGSHAKGPPSLPPRPRPGHPLFKYMVTEPHGIAVFPYKKQNYDELSFDKDDVIILLSKVDDDWLYGRNIDDEGMFPKKFIKIVRALPGESPGKVEGPCAVAVYEYYSDSPDDLMFNKDDMIKLLSRVGDDWYKGECNGEIGMFPKNYVEVIEDLPEEREDVKPDTLSGPRCRARFDFEAEGENDLDFEEGDVIKLIKPVGEEWMKGELNGKVGIFPMDFVEIIEHLPETTKAMSLPRGTMPTAAEIVVTPPTPISEDNVESALYDFEGIDSTELTFKAGDRIKVTNYVSTEWLLGECNGRKGKFPSNFISEIPPNLPPEDVSPTSTQVETGPHCIAKYDYEAASSEDLDFKEGDKIFLLERVSDDWYKGSCHGKHGIFPKTFVDVVEDLPKDASSKRSSTRQRGGSFEELMPKAEAIHDFTGESSGELTFKTGDVIYLLNKVNDDWYNGELNGHVGQFPVAFVEIVIALPDAKGL